MAGHSHSANIARRKGAVDAKRGKVFSKLARAIISAARTGGPDPEANLKLKYAIEKAKAANMPKDTIERAVARATGSKEGDQLDEITYEGYAPGGVAVLVETLTDNRNRTVSEIRHIFTKLGGSLAESGSVAWQFETRGTLFVDAEGVDEDELMMTVLDAGAEDLVLEGDAYYITVPVEDFEEVKSALPAAGISYRDAQMSRIPRAYVEVGENEQRRTLKVLDALEEQDDVQNVFTNLDISEAVAASIEEA